MFTQTVLFCDASFYFLVIILKVTNFSFDPSVSQEKKFFIVIIKKKCLFKI